MWEPKIDDYVIDERGIPAEYRTEISHIQVVRTNDGQYTVRSKTRDYDPKVDLYTPWSDWKVEIENTLLAKAMWNFARLVLEKSTIDEYRWGADARSF